MKKILILPVLLFAVSCAGENMSRLEMDFGTSYNLAKEGQTLNPEAGQNLEPVEGIDANTGNAILNSYQKGFEKEKQRSGYFFEVSKQ